MFWKCCTTRKITSSAEMNIRSSSSRKSPQSPAPFAHIDDEFNDTENVKTLGSFQKFALLSWKNWLIQWRHPLQTIIEILAPVLFSILLVVVRHLVDPIPHTDETTYTPFQVPSAMLPLPGIHFESPSLLKRISNFSIAWSPENPILFQIVNQISLMTRVSLRSFESSELLWKNLTSYGGMNSTIAGIEFPDEYANITELPYNIHYALSFPGEARFKSMHNYTELAPSDWRTRFLYPKYPLPGPRAREDNDGGYPPGYYQEGFLILQSFLTRIITNYIYKATTNTTDEMDLPEIKIQRFPYGPYIEDNLLPALAGFVSLIYMISFVYTCISTVKVITTEKEKQLKEAMKIMGLKGWLHWTAWFVKILIFMSISVTICTVLITVQWFKNKNVAVFTYSHPTIIFTTLFLYSIATISFCFMISVFFSTANMAATIAGPVWFISHTPFIFIQPQYDLISWPTKIIASLGHNSAMAFSFFIINKSEGTGVGTQWNNYMEPAVPGDELLLLHCHLMLIFDSILYLLIALYVEQIFPGDYGVPMPWYYIFTSWYWCGNLQKAPHLSIDGNLDSSIYEREPYNLKRGVEIINLRKKYGTGRKAKVAVHGLSLNMYEGQITCLLGHNGAGKTTTMSMLTGMIPPTSGTAVINGYDVSKNLKQVRASLGLCPQHNVLFNELTVEEHLYFFGRLKGVSKRAIKPEIDRYIKLLDLEPKTNTLSTHLSGGMKRKLSVGIALCGGSRVVILDEPTSGMDPSARRHLWDLLQSEKEGRTMILSTHFMDEADLLGDRIAILSGGKLQCCGSSFFLKKRYGAGYHLIMEKGPNCNVPAITALLQHYLPNLEVYSDVGSELTYILPDNKAGQFKNMLEQLESQSQTLGVNSYGISLTTLEEVFQKVGSEKHDAEDIARSQNGIDMDRLNLAFNLERVKGCALLWVHFIAMIKKRLFAATRTKILLLVQMLIPTLMLVIAILAMRAYKVLASLPELKLDINTYENGNVWVNRLYDANTTDSKTLLVANMTKRYLSEMKHPLTDIAEPNITNYLLDRFNTNLARYRIKDLFVIAVETGGNILSMFNNEGYHTIPIALNTAENILLKTVAPNHTITVYNRPLPFEIQNQISNTMRLNSLGFQVAFNLGFGMAIVTSFYVLFYIKERVSKCKHLQFVSGVNVFTFWFSAFVWDIFTFILTISGLIITFICFQEDGFRTADQLGRLVLIFLVFGIAVLPMSYLASFLFTIPSTGCVRLILLNILTGLAAFVTVEMLGAPTIDLSDKARFIEWGFLFVPHFTFSSAIRSTHMIYATVSKCKEVCSNFNSSVNYDVCIKMICKSKNLCCDMSENYYKWEYPGIGRHIVFLIIDFIVLSIILLLIETGTMKKIYYLICNSNCRSQPNQTKRTVTQIDDDVQAEKHRVDNLTMDQIDSQSLVMRNLTKYYKNFLAVNQLSVIVNKYECFGLLGVNGAGKTTTFKMVTGDEVISSGNVWVNGINVKTNIKQVHKIIGYCPQFDALIDNLTGKETMHMFCNLRGITGNNATQVSRSLAIQLDFIQHYDKQVKKYSGGNKRKLSTALALLSNPSVIYLDEPTTGMDPATKRFLWNVVCKIRDSGRCVVLTSHSMEECEALCTRLAIMVNGQFQCLGSVQHLKNKFARGIILSIKVKHSAKGEKWNQKQGVDKVKSFIQITFPNSRLQEEHNDLLTFFITDPELKWSALFGVMEDAKENLNLEDYSIAQSSLEQVFLSFAKQQREEDE